MRRSICYGLLLGLVWCADVTTTQAESLSLLQYGERNDFQLEVSGADRQWLAVKGSLRLGVNAPDNPPFDIVSNTGDYQGVTADIVGLIGKLLNLQVKVRRYPSRQAAIEALRRGEIDVLGSANTYDSAEKDLTLSQSYAVDHPALVTRTGETAVAAGELAGKRVAMLYHYLPPEQVQLAYPEAQLQLHESVQSAVSAVSFGKADVFLGDLLTANLFAHRISNLQLANFAALEPGAFALALRRDDERLHRLVNAAIEEISEEQRQEIIRRWGGGIIAPIGTALQFTKPEQAWMNRHPRIRVLFVESFVPLTFRNDEGQFRGIAADVLERISFRTGLVFDARPVVSIAEATRKIRNGEADMFAALSPSKAREEHFDFTRAYFSNPFVLVTRDTPEAPVSLEEMAGKRLAVTHGNELIGYLIKNHPKIQLVLIDNVGQILERVANGDVEGGVTNVIGARYIISRQYRDRLRIVTTIGSTPGHIAFAIDRGAKELRDILDKALLSIPPNELEDLTSLWSRDVVLEGSFWAAHRRTILSSMLAALLLLAATFVWIRRLREEIRRREEAERRLIDQIEFERVLIDGTPHPIYVRDHELRLVTCNQSYLNVFGVTREQVIGKTLCESTLGQMPEAPAFEAAYRQVMTSGEPLIRDNHLTLLNGQTIAIFHWMLPFRLGNGEMASVIAGWIDITERQRLLLEADDANRAKTTFLATMSHEIRTPLNAVIGMLELASKKAERGEYDRLTIDVASDAASHLLELIGDILDIAQVESGKLALSPERAQLGPLVESVVRVFDGLARQKHIGLQMELDPAADCDVLVDPLRFKQVISNLVGNAIKFTEEGAVRVTLRLCQPHSEYRQSVELLVEDSGIGIAEDEMLRLFRPFVQAASNQQHARNGSGLGLVICRNLSEMMGGSLTLSSTLGVGTIVRVRLAFDILPDLVTPKPGELDPIETPVRGLRVLVVDDYPANRLLLVQQLSFLGHQVVEAEDGRRGLNIWRTGHFDVVISDCNMPNMTGYEMTSLIRGEELNTGRKACLILGFTANAQIDEENRCRAAGMDGCMFKPTSLAQLSKRLGLARPIPQEIQRPSATLELIGLSDLERMSGGNVDAVKDLLDKLITTNRSDLLRLDELAAAGNNEGLRVLAHRVKGGALILKARHLEHCCEMLEEVKMESERHELDARIDNLREAILQLTDMLETYCAT
ncbi:MULTISPECIES: transporter substrate-binding domain-containing protein [unclassified Pseudomonas]|uniref:transporter substrate-binding domain-containing protein n=1 Tax=unclassified Pseudomonas TaxID=196821 RepID=UPI00119A0818|nr:MULTISPECIES: transporter substrate-binding domain-containing protein [unclassified Pseudomonas]TWC06659.1 two-component system sensor histidine kinase EvgS [Pseudomonas sp. SJZ075]TWC26641.1 two-component system sensor histidine kinase EvgS [Pseudomonas sp. SJZ078]TWC44048.1 two-component system sensor histidine kinase EvgS [Pseudomonas sp. SJZ080]TWC45353.1 two-component system sensor histidine kinase EvgS [Pseudomonas sp. SJZ124]TWC80433.1 two-component system sensor histidine kinase Evg